MKNIELPTILKLRLAVGYLGEKDQFGWWPTSFYGGTSRGFLDPVFPRTSILTRYRSVLEAASRLHDEHLSTGCYHLFRLPEEIEQHFHQLMQSSDAATFTEDSLESQEQALKVLQGVGEVAFKVISGPQSIGSIEDLHSEAVPTVLASCYFRAFSEEFRSYPYLNAVR